MNRLTDTDKGARAMAVRIKGVGAMRLTVGIHPEIGANTPYVSGASIATVAAVHEYGLGVPQRSWLRSWFDKHGRPAFTRQIRDTLTIALQDGTSPATALQHQGEFYVAEIQERMDAGIMPSLQPQTVARKERSGSTTPSTPLEDTRILRNSMESKVTLR